MNTLKDIIGPDGKVVEICLDGQSCSTFCDYHLSFTHRGSCSLYSEIHNSFPSFNCLAPGIDTGPVDHGDAVPGKRYWMASPENDIENPVIEVEIENIKSCGQKSYTRVKGYVFEGKKIDYILRFPQKIFEHKKHALEHAAKLLQEAMEKINKEIKE